MKTLNRKEVRQKIHRRIRKKVSGTADRPRLAVHYSNKNIYAQVIDDVVGRTLCAACSLDNEVELKGEIVRMEMNGRMKFGVRFLPMEKEDLHSLEKAIEG